MTHRNGFVILAALLLLLAAACTGCTSPAAPAETHAPSLSATAPAAGSGTAAITIRNFAFSPASVTVQPGTAVTWTNSDSAPHTIVSADGDPAAFNSGTLPNGGTFRFTFTVPGTYVYHCSIHPSMTGTIIVQG